MNQDSHHASGSGDASHGHAGTPTGHPFDWPARAGVVDEVLREMDLRVAVRRRRRRRYLGAASAVAGLMAIAVVGWKVQPRPVGIRAIAPPASAIVSLPERQFLPDGTIVELKSGATITVAFTAAVRRVTLTNGEAHFQVAKNPERPFVVRANEVEFRAVGTAFSVQLGHEAVELLVTEGHVAVDRADETATEQRDPDVPPVSPPTTGATAATPQTLALVGAGNRLVVSTRPATRPVASPVESVSHSELGARMAWRVPRLEFSGTPLADAIPLFNQYGTVRLTLGDTEVADVRLSGILRADNIDTLLGLLTESYGIRVEKRSENEIVLRRAR